MTEDIDYKELFERMQIENEVLNAQIKSAIAAPPITFEPPDFSWLVRWYNRDPIRAMYTAFIVLCIVGTLLQCVALWKDIRR